VQTQAYESSSCQPTPAEETIHRLYWRDKQFHSNTVKFVS
jgi:hypothetical protein